MTTLFRNTSSVCLISSYWDIFWPSGLFMFLIFFGSGPDRLDAVHTVCTGLAVTREVKRGQQKNSGGNIWSGFKRASLFVSPRDISANKKLVKLLKCHHVCFCPFLGEAALQKRERLFVHHVLKCWCQRKVRRLLCVKINEKNNFLTEKIHVNFPSSQTKCWCSR